MDVAGGISLFFGTGLLAVVLARHLRNLRNDDYAWEKDPNRRLLFVGLVAFGIGMVLTRGSLLG